MIRIPGFTRKAPENEAAPVAVPAESPAEVINPNEPFMSRFSRRKVEARQQELQEAEAAAAPIPEEPELPALTDEDMPPIESLSFDSDFTGFMSPKVSDALRRQALKKLFLSAEFNVVDGLDEYAEDYTTFEPLGDIVTSDMKHQIEMAAEREKEKAKQALLEEGEEAPTENAKAEVEQQEASISEEALEETELAQASPEDEMDDREVDYDEDETETL